MTRPITQPAVAAQRLFFEAVKTLVATYGGTKSAGDYGVVTWSEAERLMCRAGLRKIMRGMTGFRGDVVQASNP